jgi:hypothetical protein
VLAVRERYGSPELHNRRLRRIVAVQAAMLAVLIWWLVSIYAGWI